MSWCTTFLEHGVYANNAALYSAISHDRRTEALKMLDVKQTDEVAGHEIAGHENATHKNAGH